MRLDHLLSKREEVGVVLLFRCEGAPGTGAKKPEGGSGRPEGEEEATVSKKNSGGDACRGHTRSHPEHDG